MSHFKLPLHWPLVLVNLYSICYTLYTSCQVKINTKQILFSRTEGLFCYCVERRLANSCLSHRPYFFAHWMRKSFIYSFLLPFNKGLFQISKYSFISIYHCTVPNNLPLNANFDSIDDKQLQLWRSSSMPGHFRRTSANATASLLVLLIAKKSH